MLRTLVRSSEYQGSMESKVFNTSIPFILHDAAQQEFAHRFAEAYLPMTPDVLEQISVIGETWPDIWIPSHSQHRYALYLKRLAEAANEKIEREACRGFYRALEKVPHEAGTPHTFLLLLRQLNMDAFPLWYMRNRDWTGEPEGLQEAGLDWQDFTRFWHEHVFNLVRDWLKQLPLMRDELVYIASSVENTLVLPWGMFVEHWDAFAGSGGRLNVVDDDPRWYLMFHQEVLVYGCTPEYKDKKNVPEDVKETSSSEVGSIYRSIYEDRQRDMQASVSLYRKFVEEQKTISRLSSHP